MAPPRGPGDLAKKAGHFGPPLVGRVYLAFGAAQTAKISDLRLATLRKSAPGLGGGREQTARIEKPGPSVQLVYLMSCSSAYEP